VVARATREGRTMTDGTRRWFAGVDWGSEKHQVCLLDAAGTVVGERAFAHDGPGLAAMCDWLVSMAGHPGTAAVAIEVPHGPVVDVLLDRGFAVHAINPKQLDRLRDRFSVAGAKDDRRDARVAAAGLRTDPHLFRPLQAGDPGVIELREWSRLAEELQQERVRLASRIRQQLWRYYPQLLELSEDVAAAWILELWSLAPTPRPRPRRRACARRRWRACSGGTVSASSMPQACSVCCVSPRSRWPRASPRPPSCTCAPWWPGCTWPAPSSARPSDSSTRSAPG
jgi:hypothetical protein